MAYRILQHEKSDNIRIGRAYTSNNASLEVVVESVILMYVNERGVSPEEFGRYWKRIAIVDADTLAVVTTVYSE
jgi:hypothetical protein